MTGRDPHPDPGPGGASPDDPFPASPDAASAPGDPDQPWAETLPLRPGGPYPPTPGSGWSGTPTPAPSPGPAPPPASGPTPHPDDTVPVRPGLLPPDATVPIRPGFAQPADAARPVEDATGTGAAAAPPSRGATAAILVPIAVGGLVAVGLGAYGRLHEPTLVAVDLAGFSSGLAAKAWLATAAFLLALVQLWSAAVLYGRLPPRPAPRWTGAVHRWSGRAAVVISAPVAVHCLYALGFEGGSLRVLLHSLAGCFFYGAFVAKMLVLRRDDAPGWSLPVLGGAVFTGLATLWLTAALWFFTTTGLTF